MNWKAVDERMVRELALYRLGKVLREDISFDELCEEMSAFDRFVELKNDTTRPLRSVVNSQSERAEKYVPK